MTAQSKIEDLNLDAARADAETLAFHPRCTMRCEGRPIFRSQSARDLGCLLDLDADVTAWSCLPLLLKRDGQQHVPDFFVARGEGSFLLDAGQGPPPRWIEQAASDAGLRYSWRADAEIRAGHRLANARDLLRYGRWSCPLGDRVRLLAALDEHGTLTVGECLSAFRETRPIAGLSSLILARFVEVDLDEAPIGPETAVRRCRP
jgi:hypothetical protein